MRPFLALLAFLALADGRLLTFIPPIDGPCPPGTPGSVGLTTNPTGAPSADTPNHVDVYLWARDARCVVAKCRSAATGVEVSGAPRLVYYNIAVLSLSGLEPGTQYACEAADVVGDASGPVAAFNFTTLAICCGETSRNIGSTTASITFTAPRDTFSFYPRLMPSDPVHSAVVYRTGNPQEFVASASGLVPDTAYQFALQGSGQRYTGNWDVVFEFRTAPAPEPSPSPVPASPKPKPSPVPVSKPAKPVLRSVKTTKNGAVVTTTKPARATSFRASCRVDGTAKKVPSSLAVSKTSLVATLKNLKPGTTYACDILGANKSGAGAALAVKFRIKK